MKRHSLDLVVVVSLFCVYAACAFMLCAIGAQVYRGTADTMGHNYNGRTSVLYLAEKIRHNDLEGSVRVDAVNGIDALVLIERQSGRNFETWLFVQDRILYEGVFAPGTTPDVALCQPLLPMDSMTVSISQTNGQLVSVSFVAVDGKTNSIDLWLRTARKQGA